MGRRTGKLAALAGIVASLVIVAPAGAITNGQADAGEHPYVGELFFYVPDDIDDRFTDPGSWYSCSGTLISPTIVVTAGHCAYAVGRDGTSTTDGAGEDGSGDNDVWVDFAEAPDFSDILAAPFVATDDNAGRYQHYRDTLNGRPEWHRGTAYTHPQFDNDAFYLHDLGVVILDRPVQLATYGRLPALRYLDRYKGKQKQSLFESVGYGVEKSTPKTEEGGDTRRKSLQTIVNFNGVFGLGPDVALVFSHNNSPKHQGGTCYGDSGGPTFVNDTNLMVAITSFGLPPNCTGNDVQYRVDQSDDLDWLAAVVAGHPR
jgi:trypsin